MKTVLVTGSSGFIGSNLVSKIKDNYKLILCDRKNDLDYVTIELSDKVDVVVHLANYKYNDDPDALYYDASNLHRLIDKVIDCDKFIYASSAAVYPDEITSLSDYGLSKCSQEAQLESSGLKSVDILRFFNVYGPNANSGIVGILIDKIKNNQPIYIDGDGLQTRDYVYVDDVVNSIIKRIECNDSSIRSIHDVGTGVETTVLDLISIISEIYQTKPIIKFSDKSEGVYSSRAKIIRADFKDIVEGIKATINYK
jgi:UDP-glucose 4-epimerase